MQKSETMSTCAFWGAFLSLKKKMPNDVHSPTYTPKWYIPWGNIIWGPFLFTSLWVVVWLCPLRNVKWIHGNVLPASPPFEPQCHPDHGAVRRVPIFVANRLLYVGNLGLIHTPCTLWVSSGPPRLAPPNKTPQIHKSWEISLRVYWKSQFQSLISSTKNGWSCEFFFGEAKAKKNQYGLISTWCEALKVTVFGCFGSSQNDDFGPRSIHLYPKTKTMLDKTAPLPESP